MKLGPGMRFIDEEMGGQMLEGGEVVGNPWRGRSYVTMTLMYGLHMQAIHDLWNSLEVLAIKTAYVMKRCSLGCIHLDSDSQLLRGAWGGVGEGRVSRHNVFLVSGVDAKMLPAVFLFISFLSDLLVGIPTWKSLHHFTLVVLSPVATVKS